MANNTVGSVQVVLSVSYDGLKKGFAAAESLTKKFSDVANAAAANIARLTVGMTAATAAIGYFTYKGMAAIDNLHDQAAELGLTTEAWSSLTFAAAASGVAAEDVQKSMNKLAVVIHDAGVESQTAMAALQRVGLTAKELEGLTADKRLEAVADGLAAIPDAGNRAAAAIEIFGKNVGVKMLDILANGSQAIKEARQEAEALGLTLSTVDSERVETAFEKLARVWEVVSGIGKALAIGFSPAITVASDYILDFVKRMGGLGSITKIAAEIAVISMRSIGNGIQGAIKMTGYLIQSFGVLSSTIYSTYSFWQEKINTIEIGKKLVEMHRLADEINKVGKNSKLTAQEIVNIKQAGLDQLKEMGRELAELQTAGGDNSERMKNLQSQADRIKDLGVATYNFSESLSDSVGSLGDQLAANIAKLSADPSVSPEALASRIAKMRQAIADAGKEEERKKNRQAYIATADSDPRVIYEREVLANLSKIGQEHEDAVRRTEERKFLATITASGYLDPRVAREIQVQAKLREIKEDEVKAEMEMEKEKNRVNMQGASDLAGNLAALTADAQGAGFAAHKMFAIAQATINAALSITNVLASPFAMANPLAGIALASSVGALAAVQVGMIAAQQPPSGRKLGGPTSSRSMYKVGEGGRPELFDTGGDTYLLTGGANGHVRPAGGGSSPGANVSVQIINNSGSSATSQESTGPNGDRLIRVVIGEMSRDISTGGPMSRQMQSTFGLSRASGAR